MRVDLGSALTASGTRAGGLRGCGTGLQPVDLRRGGFTIVELVVVIAVIVLVLAVAVPGISAMNAEARLTSASQLVNASMTRAYYLALGDVNMTAVRFLPGEWNADDEEGEQRAAGRQHVVIYSYTGVTYDASGTSIDPYEVSFNDYFARRKESSTVELPEDVWVAPLESLSTAVAQVPWEKSPQTTVWQRYNNLGRDFVLSGEAGAFSLDAGNRSGSDALLNADDFLIVVDPKAGVYSGVPRSFRLRAFAPNLGYEADRGPSDVPYQRYAFSGVVVYRRKPFVELGNDPAERQAQLRERGRPFMAHRYSGGLMAGMRNTQ